MLKRLSPETLRAVPTQFRGIYAHGTLATNPRQLLFLSGQIGINSQGDTAEGFVSQTHQAMDNVEALLGASGMTREDILRVVYYVTDAANLEQLTKIRQARWNSLNPPAVTTLVVAGLASPDLMVEIEVTASI